MIQDFRRRLFNWLFIEFANSVNQGMVDFQRKLEAKGLDTLQQEQQAFMREFREGARDEAKQTERRHQELCAAIRELK